MITMKERIQEMTDIVNTNLTRAHKKQKPHYDEGVKPQNLQPEDKVLVLMAARHKKLQLEWVGPYKVTTLSIMRLRPRAA